MEPQSQDTSLDRRIKGLLLEGPVISPVVKGRAQRDLVAVMATQLRVKARDVTQSLQRLESTDIVAIKVDFERHATQIELMKPGRRVPPGRPAPTGPSTLAHARGTAHVDAPANTRRFTGRDSVCCLLLPIQRSYTRRSGISATLPDAIRLDYHERYGESLEPNEYALHLEHLRTRRLYVGYSRGYWVLPRKVVLDQLTSRVFRALLTASDRRGFSDMLPRQLLNRHFHFSEQQLGPPLFRLWSLGVYQVLENGYWVDPDLQPVCPAEIGND